jgi:hypothetical protein
MNAVCARHYKYNAVGKHNVRVSHQWLNYARRMVSLSVMASLPFSGCTLHENDSRAYGSKRRERGGTAKNKASMKVRIILAGTLTQARPKEIR